MPLVDLIQSCNGYIDYPRNLGHNESTRPYILTSLHEKLAEEAPRIFCRDGAAKLNILRVDRSRKSLTEIQSTNFLTLQHQLPCDASQNKDLLICRLAFIEAHSARDVLDVSKNMMLWLLSIFQTMPNFLEFVFPFGEQLYDYDFQFSAFRSDIRLGKDSTRGEYIDVLRSGKDFQMCYNLKTIESKKADQWQWSARQAAIFHSFDVVTGQANWIIIKAKGNLRERLAEALRAAILAKQDIYEEMSTKFANSLMCHLVVVDWCAENWRWYVKYLEEQLEISTSRALLYNPTGAFSKDDFLIARTSLPAPQPLFTRGRTWTGRILRTNTIRPAPRSPVRLQPIMPLPTTATIQYEDPDQLPPGFSPEVEATFGVGSKEGIQIDELQNAQYLESKAGEASLILRSNIGILTSMSQHYADIAIEIAKLSSPGVNDAFKIAAQLEISKFERHMRQVRADLESHLARMNTITKLATDRKTLLYSLVDYQNMQANENFAKKSQASAQRMEDMTEDMQKLTRKTAVETVLMRIITIVTVLFLPATFVSTMMSANIITFKPQDWSISAGSTSLGAVKFFLCLTLSLMAATLGAGFILFLYEADRPSDAAVRAGGP